MLLSDSGLSSASKTKRPLPQWKHQSSDWAAAPTWRKRSSSTTRTLVKAAGAAIRWGKERLSFHCRLVCGTSSGDWSDPIDPCLCPPPRAAARRCRPLDLVARWRQPFRWPAVSPAGAATQHPSPPPSRSKEKRRTGSSGRCESSADAVTGRFPSGRRHSVTARGRHCAHIRSSQARDGASNTSSWGRHRARISGLPTGNMAGKQKSERAVGWEEAFTGGLIGRRAGLMG